MGDYGIKISLDGYDVKEATPEQCSLHSGYACPKMKLNQTPSHFGILTVNPGILAIDETKILVTIAHGFSYTPSCFALVKYKDGDSSYRTNTLPAAFGISPCWAETNSTNFTIKLFNATGMEMDFNQDLKFKYYIFVENGA